MRPAAAPCKKPEISKWHSGLAQQRSANIVCSYAGAAQAVAPSIACRTVIKLSTPDDLQLVLTGNDLVAEVFYNKADSPLLDAVNFNSYRVRSAAQTLSLHMSPSRTHATIVALGAAQAAAPEQQQQQRQQQQQQQRRQQWQPQQPWVPSRQQEDRCKAVGVVNVSLMRASPSIATAAAVKPGTPFAMITNMAVCPQLRRRGIAHLLMQAAMRTALLDLDLSPPFCLLLAYKYCEPAMRLYESWGFEHTPWVDPVWKEDAEKGRVVRQRRLMLVKPLSGPSLGLHHLRSSSSSSSSSL